jgi:hypothetical protein
VFFFTKAVFFDIIIFSFLTFIFMIKKGKLLLALVVVVVAVAASAFYYINEASGSDTPPELKIAGGSYQGAILGDKAMKMFLFETSDLGKDVLKGDSLEILKQGINYFYLAEDTPLYEIIHSIEVIPCYRYLFAFYDPAVQQYRVFPEGPFAGTDPYDVELYGDKDVDPVVIPANTGFVMIVDKVIRESVLEDVRDNGTFAADAALDPAVLCKEGDSTVASDFTMYGVKAATDKDVVISALTVPTDLEGWILVAVPNGPLNKTLVDAMKIPIERMKSVWPQSGANDFKKADKTKLNEVIIGTTYDYNLVWLNLEEGGPVDPSCVPACTGKTCGDNGCDGSCGSCADGEACSDGGICKALEEDPCPADWQKYNEITEMCMCNPADCNNTGSATNPKVCMTVDPRTSLLPPQIASICGCNSTACIAQGGACANNECVMPEETCATVTCDEGFTCISENDTATCVTLCTVANCTDDQYCEPVSGTCNDNIPTPAGNGGLRMIDLAGFKKAAEENPCNGVTLLHPEWQVCDGGDLECDQDKCEDSGKPSGIRTNKADVISMTCTKDLSNCVETCDLTPCGLNQTCDKSTGECKALAQLGGNELAPASDTEGQGDSRTLGGSGTQPAADLSLNLGSKVDIGPIGDNTCEKELWEDCDEDGVAHCNDTRCEGYGAKQTPRKDMECNNADECVVVDVAPVGDSTPGYTGPEYTGGTYTPPERQ